MNSPDAVLFIGFGGPEKSDDVMPFLEIVTRGRGIPKERFLNVAHHYELMGGKSPINAITRQQAAGLEAALKNVGSPLPVFIGQRNWHPFLADTLQKMASKGIKRAIGFPAAPHRCEASLERYINATEEARRQMGESAPVIEYVGPWFDHPLFIEAIAERVKETLQSVPVERQASMKWYFTAHSIPCGMAKGSTYVQELRRTAQLVCQKLGRKDWALAYSSRSGNPSEPWLEPDVCDLIRSDANKGVSTIFYIPIGFIADHVEILFDLDVEAKEAAKESGIALYRSRSVGDHPLFTRMMAEVVRSRISQPEKPEQRSSIITRYADGQQESMAGPSTDVCYCHPNTEDPPCARWVRASAGRSIHSPKKS